METFPAYPTSKGSGPINASRVSEVPLGDGYGQSAALTPDNLALRYRLVFTARPLAHVSAMESFLRRHAGHVAFAFTLPGEAAARAWRCEDWIHERIAADVRSLTATLIEVA